MPSPNRTEHINLTDEEATELGLALLNWNLIEREMFWMVAAMLNVDVNCAMVIMGAPSVPQQVDVLVAVAKSKLTDNGVLGELLNCGNKVKELSGFRNEFVHGQWWDSLEIEDGDFTLILQKKGAEKERLLGSFKRECAKLPVLLGRLSELHIRIKKVIAASPTS